VTEKEHMEPDRPAPWIDVDPSRPNETIDAYYADLKAATLRAADCGDAEACLQSLWECWMFMNRFRNCDLRHYFDPELQRCVTQVNPRRFDTSHLLKPKREFRIAYVLPSFADTGGASVAHRFILEDASAVDGISFQQYVLVTNIGNQTNLERTTGYQYLRDHVRLEKFEVMPPSPSWVAKGKYLEAWLHEQGIDFAVVEVDPVSLYAMVSRPVLLSATLSQDSHTFTVGPGFCDFTFLVTRDQLFKYTFAGEAPEQAMKLLLLPLHAQEYIDATVPIPRRDLGIPEDAVVSATTNIWKSCFGDGEALLRGIAVLARRHPRYHHVFAGTSRALDTVDYFLSRHPDLRGRIHYGGVIQNLYRLLKTIDFFVNSCPISGGSDIEAAAVGVPTIEFLTNRNLTLHECEFLQSLECQVNSLEDFIRLGNRFIIDAEYRTDLGRYLQAKVRRELDKRRILHGRLYAAFIQEFQRQLEGRPLAPALELDQTIHYEKLMGLFAKLPRDRWSAENRRRLLDYCIDRFRERPFAWIKCYEEAILARDRTWFEDVNRRIVGTDLDKDARIHIMQALSHRAFGDMAGAVRRATTGAELSTHDSMPRRVLARLLLESGRRTEALEVLRACRLVSVGPDRVAEENLLEQATQLDLDALPIFYSY